MNELNVSEIGLKVGLEIHQQLNTKTKLFCNCEPMNEEEVAFNFLRRLRPTQSELGQVDPAALFESKRERLIKYCAGRNSSCLVEADEEPPHDLNPQAVESALLVALALNAEPVDEIHVMRKIVIDGSNTTGFQRTAIIALGGSLRVHDRIIPIQTISLEEDAARFLYEDQHLRVYGLDRLGIPLVEVALAPITGTPQEVEEVALGMGRLMRSTGRASRGLGTIRQDVNISLAGQGVVEVKGVQKLNLLAKVIEFEIKRQLGLLKISDELRKRKVKIADKPLTPLDVTLFFKKSSNKILKDISDTGRVLAIGLPGFGNLMGFEPYPSIRLGKEMAELVRFYGLGGILHSDELPGYDISELEVRQLSGMLNITEADGFVILAGGKTEVYAAASAVIERAGEATLGVPAETRAPTEDGKTKFIRPRPGEARMYPETDILTMPLRAEMKEKVRRLVPQPYEEQIKEYKLRYGLNEKLAFQIYDSDFSDLFKRIATETKVHPSFIAATLTETLVSISRMGLDIFKLKEETIVDLFNAVDRGSLSKEAIPLIIENVLRDVVVNVDDAMRQLELQTVTEDELRSIISGIVEANEREICNKGEQAYSRLMGKVMAVVRGRADGQKVGIILREEINRIVKERK